MLECILIVFIAMTSHNFMLLWVGLYSLLIKKIITFQFECAQLTHCHSYSFLLLTKHCNLKRILTAFALVNSQHVQNDISNMPVFNEK
jgi:hypothetical protein